MYWIIILRLNLLNIYIFLFLLYGHITRDYFIIADSQYKHNTNRSNRISYLNYIFILLEVINNWKYALKAVSNHIKNHNDINNDILKIKNDLNT